MADRLGQQLGNYRLVALLGTGGFADVYLGQHTRFNQQAAIKVLHAHLSGQESSSFQHEAETAPGDHYTLVRNHRYYRASEGLPYLDKVEFRIVNRDAILHLLRPLLK